MQCIRKGAPLRHERVDGVDCVREEREKMKSQKQKIMSASSSVSSITSPTGLGTGQGYEYQIDTVIRQLEQYEDGMSEVSRQQRELIPALAWRSYHLPGNSWCQDWMQYYKNNHPVFGICCHHKLHPIKFRMRIVNLVGSILFGLLITNIFWLWYVFDETRNPNSALLTISLGETGSSSSGRTQETIAITKGMFVLWTIGGVLHALFDNTVWYITACVWCQPGQRLENLHSYRWFGPYIVTFCVVIVAALATLAVLLRASVTSDGSAGDDRVPIHVENKEAYSFLLSYVIELLLSLFVYYPLIFSLLFSGVLGCGRVPILGGRPYEVWLEGRRRNRSVRFSNDQKELSHTSFSHTDTQV